jgi:hypothetical protein
MTKPREAWVDNALFEAKGYFQRSVWASDFERPATIAVVLKADYLELLAEAEKLQFALDLSRRSQYEAAKAFDEFKKARGE